MPKTKELNRGRDCDAMTAVIISTDFDESHESFSKISSSLTFPICKYFLMD